MQDTPFDYADDINAGQNVLVTRHDGSNVYLEAGNPPFQKPNGIYSIVGKLMPSLSDDVFIPTDEIMGYTLPEKKRTVY